MITFTSMLTVPLIVIVIFFYKIKKNGLVSVAKLILKTEIIIACLIVICLVVSKLLPLGIFIMSRALILLAHLAVPIGLIGLIVSIIVILKKLEYSKLSLFFVLFLSLMLIVVGFGQYKDEANYLSSIKKQSNQAENKFDEISERFKQPQKVIGMDRVRFLLEGEVSVNLDGIDYQTYKKNPNIEKDINDFANKNIVGNYISIVLPLKIVCGSPNLMAYKDCFAEHGDVEFPIMYGKIYFNGESLGEKFGLK